MRPTHPQYKTFQLGDILANLAGSSIGLYAAYHSERKYRARREIETLYSPLRADTNQADDIYDVGDWDGSDTSDVQDHSSSHARPSDRRLSAIWSDRPYEAHPAQVNSAASGGTFFMLDDESADPQPTMK